VRRSRFQLITYEESGGIIETVLAAAALASSFSAFGPKRQLRGFKAEAMSAADAGPRELLISTAKVEDCGVLVAVQDSGPALEAAMLERVFESFYTTKPTGFGLGLSICRSIIEAHGGRLWATRCEPRGALFQFTVPAD
jgi:signal transduction histidine kinase